MAWTAPFPQFVQGPIDGEDRPILEGYLTWQRTTLLNICAGLSSDQLASRPRPPSNLSLLGLVRHLAKVERIWFRQRAAAEPIGPMFDQRRGKDCDFARFRDEWRRADEAVAGMAFDDTFDVGGEVFSLRMAYVHTIGEYSRHNGHADLIREAIDGTTGR